ncbi:MAG: endo alpha-1,4 polygalactosaminidase [Elusimicrobia bacterium]|nr:endo alpha-1,4 polygalactosaminidase [Elusimicrobiota bacterium]
MISTLAAAWLAGAAAAAPAAPSKKKAPSPAPAPAPSARARPGVAAARRWACFYGQNLSERAWTGLELAILDPDGFKAPASTGPVKLAYVSIGEADERRSFWGEVRGKPWVVEPNPDWPKAHRVDVRAAQWQALLLDRVIPGALAKGYDGVMFDTVDTAEHFESSAPARFAGSVAAAAGFVRAVRRKHPSAAILLNNGLAVAEAAASEIDGVVVEDLYTRCLPQSPECGPTPEDESAAKEARLKAFVEKSGKPVFVLLYARLEERRKGWLADAVERSRKNGFRPYVVVPSLERLGVVDPRP